MTILTPVRQQIMPRLKQAASTQPVQQLIRFFRQHPRWALVLGVAIASDIIDYFGGAIPIIGDVIDLASTAVLFPALGGKRSVFGLIELIPGADFLPTYTVLVLWAIWREMQTSGPVPEPSFRSDVV